LIVIVFWHGLIGDRPEGIHRHGLGRDLVGCLAVVLVRGVDQIDSTVRRQAGASGDPASQVW